MLVEATTVDALIANLKAKGRKTSQEILQSSLCLPSHPFIHVSYHQILVVASLSDDDDIVAGPQKLSLKCPVCIFF
jgi:E3 SUMO-protein ligase PIAS1